MCGKNGIFKGANLRFAVENAFPAPPSPGNSEEFQKFIADQNEALEVVETLKKELL